MEMTLTDGDSASFRGGLREVASDTYAWLQPNGGLGESNAGLIVGEGASLLIDTLWDRSLTAAMLQAMAPVLARAPLERVVNTHCDGDHWWGNAAVPAGVEIVAGARAATAMRRDVSPRELAGLVAFLELAGRLPGRIGAPLREGAKRFGPFDFGSVRLRYPDRTFERRMGFDAGGREVWAEEIGPVHSPADAVLHVPDAGVVFAGDLLFVGVTPIMWIGPAENWIAACERLLAFDAAVYVPGHGDVGGQAEVSRIRDYWLWVRDRARELHAREHPPPLAARELLADRDFAWRDWREPERIVANLDAIYRGFDGRAPLGPRSPARVLLMRRIAELAAERAS